MGDIRAFFFFYPADWLTDERVRLMTFEERGLYLELLCYQWREGSLPSESESLAGILGLSSDHLERIWQPRVSACFVSNGHGRLINRRMAKVRKQAQKKHQERSASGRKGARSRWHDVSEVEEPQEDKPSGSAIAQSMAPPMPGHWQSESESESESEEDTTSVDTPVAWPTELQFIEEILIRTGAHEIAPDLCDAAFMNKVRERWANDADVVWDEELEAYLEWHWMKKRHKNRRQGFMRWLGRKKADARYREKKYGRERDGETQAG